MRGWGHRRNAVTAVVAWSTVILTACSGEVPAPEVLSESVTPSSTTTMVTTTTTEAAPPTALGPSECVARAPLFSVVGQVVLATVTQDRVTELVGDVVRGYVGGVVLVGDADGRLAEALAPLTSAWPPPIVAVDEEGGTVQRLAAILGDQPSARELADAGDPNVTRAAGAARGAGAAQLGFNMVLAPVLDVGGSSHSASRAYGDDVETVLAHGLAYAEGLTLAGVTPVAKHFPGHGSADADSHLTLPSTPDIEVMRITDLVPFVAAAATIPAVMTGHLAVPGLTDDDPVTLSASALDLLRREVGFDGLVVTDDLSMGALSKWSVPEAAELAIAAGNDVVIAGGRDDALESADRLAEAVVAGRLDRSRIDDAVQRVLAIKGVDPCEAWNTGTRPRADSS